MAHTYFFLIASSLVLSSLAVIASADGYGYDAPKSTYTPTPSYETPTSEYTSETVYSPPPSTYKSPVYTPAPAYHATPVYTPRPTYASYSEEKEMATIYGIQGIIYCRYGYHLTPLKGATAKIACMTKGYKPASFSLVTDETDENGYFLATLTQKELGQLKPKNCKVYLNSSPSKSCTIATDIGKGISGAPLAYSRIIYSYMNKYNMELYSVSPFVYKSADYKTPNYTPKSTYDKPTYAPETEYKTPTYTPKSTYAPEAAYKAPTYSPEEAEYKTPTSSSEVQYEAPTYSPETEYKAPTYSPETEYSTPEMPKSTPVGY